MTDWNIFWRMVEIAGGIVAIGLALLFLVAVVGMAKLASERRPRGR